MTRGSASSARLALALSLVSIATAAIAVDAQRGTGTVSGVVRLTQVKTPLATSTYARRGVAARPRVATPETRNVIVYVLDLKPGAPPPPMRGRITQRDEQFLPQVVAITTGSTVDFPNEDPFFHNVFSLSKAKTFDLGRYPTGKSRSVTFRTPGVVKVFCDIHSHMTALVRVFDHPWFVIPDEDGSFTLPQVPAGELTVVAWHERIGERRERVTLPPGGAAKLSFTLPVLEPSQ